MKIKLFGVTALLAVMVVGCGQRVLVQPTVDVKKYNRVAVLPFESDSFLSTIGHQLADEVVVQLINKVPELDVIERTRVDALMQEQNLASLGYLSAESAIAVGKMLGVSGIITGSVAFSVGDIRTTRENEQRVATGIVTARFIDVETGRVVWAKRESSDYTLFKTMDNQGVAYSVKTDQEMIQEVITELADSIAKHFYPHYEIQF